MFGNVFLKLYINILYIILKQYVFLNKLRQCIYIFKTILYRTLHIYFIIIQNIFLVTGLQ